MPQIENKETSKKFRRKRNKSKRVETQEELLKKINKVSIAELLKAQPDPEKEEELAEQVNKVSLGQLLKYRFDLEKEEAKIKTSGYDNIFHFYPGQYEKLLEVRNQALKERRARDISEERAMKAIDNMMFFTLLGVLVLVVSFISCIILKH